MEAVQQESMKVQTFQTESYHFLPILIIILREEKSFLRLSEWV